MEPFEASETSSFCVASAGSLVSGISHDFVILMMSAGTAGLTHNASGMGVLVAGTGDGEEGAGVCVAIDNSVAGAHAVRIAMQTKATRNFFIRLNLFDSIADLNCA